MYNLLKPFNLWLTGLPSSGKSTTSVAIKKWLDENNIKSVILDGDIVRSGLNSDLGFSEKDRSENNRRIIHVSEIIVKSGIPVITAFISPYEETRQFARKIIPNFIEVFIDTPLEECIKRDVKGLYERAQKGEIKKMTGIDDRYDLPKDPELRLKTKGVSLKDNIQRVIEYLEENGYIEKC